MLYLCVLSAHSVGLTSRGSPCRHAAGGCPSPRHAAKQPCRACCPRLLVTLALSLSLLLLDQLQGKQVEAVQPAAKYPHCQCRVCRPLIICDKGHPRVSHGHMDRLRDGSWTFTHFLQNGLVEYLDVNEVGLA